jgi:hypothetical protein
MRRKLVCEKCDFANNILGTTEYKYITTVVQYKTARLLFKHIYSADDTKGYSQMLPPSNIKLPASPSPRLHKIVVAPSITTADKK